MADPNASQTTLRDTLSAQFDAASEGAADTSAVIQQAAPSTETTEQAAQRARDEQGRFAKAAEQQAAAGTQQTAQPAAVVAPPAGTSPVPQPQEGVQAEPIARPTTWKREYLPLYDKLAAGLPLTSEESRKLAPYMTQREKEFATGVSTYKAEAQNSKELQDAILPFLPDLQKSNINPAVWITNLGNAHSMLVKGTPEQKFSMFAQLAKQYGVPLAGVGAQAEGQQVAPVVTELMQQIESLKSQVNTVTGWREQQEQQTLQKELSKFTDAEKYPHFEAVRGDMAQLLESGVAKDLEQAYAKAVRLNDDVWTQEQERQASVAAAARAAEEKVAAAAAAKTRAVSTKSVTPSGTAVNTGPKDRRAALSERFDSLGSSRV